MRHTVQEAFDRLPHSLEKNAPGMMRRIIDRMRRQLSAAERPGDVSHGMLFLKVAEEDLVREFSVAVTSTFVKNEPSDFAGLSLETEGARLDDSAFASSDAAFDALGACLDRLGVHGLSRYGRDRFVEAMRDAFIRSRMDERATREITPSARLALNVELQALYAQLLAWANKASGS